MLHLQGCGGELHSCGVGQAHGHPTKEDSLERGRLTLTAG